MTAPVAVADVAIVGCGVIGLATAERLVACNLSVIMVDRLGVAAGVTGASGGLVRAYEENFPDLAAEGLDIYLRQGWRGRWPAIRGHGSLMLFDADGADRAATGADRLTAAGFPVEVLSAKDIHTRFAGMSIPADFAGLFEPRAGWLPARDLAQAMLADASSGVTVLDSLQAREVVTTGEHVSGVYTTAGHVRAKVVLLAAGTGSSALARTVGVDLPLRTRSVSYCVFRRPRGHLPTMVDTTTGAWLRPWATPDGVLAGVASRRCDVPRVVADGVPFDEQQRVRDVVRHRYPPLAEAEVIGGVTAHDAMSPDAKGSVTVWDQPAGLVTATGWNGTGFKLAPSVGRHTADRIRDLIA